jgi:RNA:NAD 2'-phosphotransferase (TPT1/KptA family)
MVRDVVLISILAKEGLSKMKRNHIHLAQNVVGEGVISGMSPYIAVA